MSQLATAADVTARFPETAAVDSALVAFALEDAAQMIDVSVWTGRTLRAHVLLTCHYLAKRGQLATNQAAGGPLVGWKAGEIGASYAATAVSWGDPSLAMTRYGQEFLEIRSTLSSIPCSV